ncbi:MAG: hypothetical protein NXI20_03530 [bacterium]|nr:hypothetical protein [bacterium]
MTLNQIFVKNKAKDALIAHLKGDFKDDILRRSKNPHSLENVEMEIVKTLLSDPAGKWVAASILEVLESLPGNLFIPVLRTSLETEDPSYNSFFVEPLVRIFGEIRVIESLTEILEEDFNNAKVILRVIYHVNSKVRSVGHFFGKQDIRWETKGFNYEWNAEQKKFIQDTRNSKAMSQIELDQYIPTHKNFMNLKKELVLKIKSKTTDRSIIEEANRCLEKLTNYQLKG